MWATSFLEEAVWLGCNEVWPTHMNKEPGDSHVVFFYEEFPEKLMAEYNGHEPHKRAADIRLVFDVLGGMRGLMKRAQAELLRIEGEQRYRGQPIQLPDQPFRMPLV